ncbi:MAG TPA: hypothetical protein VNM69_03520 [Bacillus sp. (in: firmicutes)]|uniref:hypothetical protein n=1 Tax=Bacillus litorisediminis TaxID=2922713 RepID=UPI001FADE5EA|nr:hypothetical protein [Bacillus litorisediminis]HWO74972.1 hypothetical protein [Bacillus sp. (in: firmicutes)]
MAFPIRNSRFSVNNDEEMNQIMNKNDLAVRQSGNSDVDVNVNVNVDTRAIAYALLISMHERKQLSSEEFNSAVRKLDELIERAERRNRHQSRPWLNY